MGSFSTEATRASQIETSAAVSSFTGAREGTRSGYAGGGLFGNSNVSSDYDVVGINATKVPIMRDAIRDYVKNIQEYLEQIGANTSSSQAGAIQNEDVKAAVDKYITAVKEYAQNLVSYILTFSDKLKDVQDAWEKQAKSMAGNIDSAAGGFGTSGAYTEQL